MAEPGGSAPAPSLEPRQLELVLRTLAVAIADAVERSDGTERAHLAELLRPVAELASGPGAQPDPVPQRHPSAPAPGTSADVRFVVSDADTAAAMGHPDERVAILGSPRIALWFEMATSEVMPPAGSPESHVGVGILVHHLGRADVGEEVVVRVTVRDVTGRTVTFACEARTGERLVALGTHQRVILKALS